MRVISGKARGHKLLSPKGLHTRPTADRVKEAIFSILMNHVPESEFLDLYSGSGALGIEALSRGARHAVFVDNNEESIDIIKKNLEKVRLFSDGEVIKADVISALSTLKRRGNKFDIIFMDPPYHGNFVYDALAQICKTGILAESGIVVAEIAPDEEIDIDESLGIRIFNIKNYNIAKIVFFERSDHRDGSISGEL